MTGVQLVTELASCMLEHVNHQSCTDTRAWCSVCQLRCGATVFLADGSSQAVCDGREVCITVMPLLSLKLLTATACLLHSVLGVCASAVRLIDDGAILDVAYGLRQQL